MRESERENAERVAHRKGPMVVKTAQMVHGMRLVFLP